MLKIALVLLVPLLTKFTEQSTQSSHRPTTPTGMNHNLEQDLCPTCFVVMPNNQGERREAAAADVRFVSELNGCLPFAPPCWCAPDMGVN